jgi:hypothetical protein
MVHAQNAEEVRVEGALEQEQRLFAVPVEDVVQAGTGTWAIVDPDEASARLVVPEIRVDEVEEQDVSRRRVRFNEEMRMHSFGGREYVGRVKEHDGKMDRDGKEREE